jgi:hypothetical protein
LQDDSHAAYAALACIVGIALLGTGTLKKASPDFWVTKTVD